jgi:hypothetical protein
MDEEIRNFFTEQGEFTDLGVYSDEVSNIPGDVKVLTQIVQGNLLHDGFYKNYGLKHKSGLYHYVQDLLDEIKRINSNSITVPRDPTQQVQVCCRDFTVLLTSLLRDKKIPARGRCGFVSFGNNGANRWDHWQCEYWNIDLNRWVKVDAQLNPHVRQTWNLGFDPYDVPDKVFKIAGEIWISWRKKEVDASNFIVDNLSGSWLIRGNLIRDFLAINKIELEPHMMRINMGLDWKSWRILSADDSELTNEDWKLLDKIAELTLEADKNFKEIRQIFTENSDLQPPSDLYPRFKAE